MEITKSIIKKFRRKIWSKFVSAVKDYNLIEENDKIAVCISGGKDSFLLALCLDELKRHGQFKFDLVFLCMNPGYKKENLDKIKENASKMGIDINIFESNIFEVVDKSDLSSPCYLCARMRRGCLYNKAKEMGCNKIALGHHFNDVIETSLLNILFAGQTGGMPPKLKSDNFLDMELIRPLYYVREKDIIRFANGNNLEFLNCACKFTEKNETENTSKRIEIKQLIKELKKINPNIDNNVFKSTFDINLNTVLGYHKSKDDTYNFLDDYDKE